MKLLARISLLIVVTLLVFSAPGWAAVRWCKADPIVRLDGTRVQVLVSIPEEYESLVDNPTRVEIKTPQQVSRELLMLDAGFNNKGEDFSFSDIGDDYRDGNTFWIWSKVTVPIKTSEIVPIRVEVIPSNGPAGVFYGDHTGTELMMQVSGSGALR